VVLDAVEDSEEVVSVAVLLLVQISQARSQ
jgi:hypothetical protein